MKFLPTPPVTLKTHEVLKTLTYGLKFSFAMLESHLQCIAKMSLKLRNKELLKNIIISFLHLGFTMEEFPKALVHISW